MGRRRRTLLAAIAIVALPLASLPLAACGSGARLPCPFAAEFVGPSDLAPLRAAIEGASPVVVAVDELWFHPDGLSCGLVMTLLVDASGALPAAELERIGEAAWAHAPLPANTITIVALEADDPERSVSLAAAAEALMPGGWIPFVSEGVVLADVRAAFGPGAGAR